MMFKENKKAPTFAVGAFLFGGVLSNHRLFDFVVDGVFQSAESL